MRKGSRCSRDLRTKSLCSQSKTQCQTQTGFRGFFSLANRPKNWKLNQEHLFRHMVHTFYRKDDLPLEHLSSSSTNVTSLDSKHFTGFFSKRYVLFQPELIWEKCGLCNPHVWGFRLADCSVFLEPENCRSTNMSTYQAKRQQQCKCLLEKEVLYFPVLLLQVQSLFPVWRCQL